MNREKIYRKMSRSIHCLLVEELIEKHSKTFWKDIESLNTCMLKQESKFKEHYLKEK